MPIDLIIHPVKSVMRFLGIDRDPVVAATLNDGVKKSQLIIDNARRPAQTPAFQEREEKNVSTSKNSETQVQE